MTGRSTESTPERLIRVLDDDTPFLLLTAATTGIGSSDVLLDRGQAGPTSVVTWRLDGDRALLVAHRTAPSADGPLTAPVRESFADAVLAVLPVIAAVPGADPESDPTTLVLDPTPLAAFDAFGAIGALRDGIGAEYRVDADRSTLDRVRVTDGNDRVASSIEIDVTLALTSDAPGDRLAGIVADPRSLAVGVRLSVVPLPEPGFVPTPYSAREGTGHMHVDVHDAPHGVGVGRELRPRFRTPLDGGSDADDSTGSDSAGIVFHLDPDIPEPYRSAIKEGANWWGPLFEDAGVPGGFRVVDLPPDVDPHDAGVSMIWWVHRIGRGWSWGEFHLDPRTGEVLAGAVRLGSQRIHQLGELGDALLAPYAEQGGSEHSADRVAVVERLVLGRLRQLAAHEVGHSIGFAHAFASHRHPVPSVMDYPFPVMDGAVAGDDLVVDLTRPYATGPGPWDRQLVQSLYGAPGRAGGTPHASLARDAVAPGTDVPGTDAPGTDAVAVLVHATDLDSRDVSSLNVVGAPWIAPGDPFDGLRTILRVRDRALRAFGPGVLAPGRDPLDLARRAEWLQLAHRSHAEAVLRHVGGVRTRYGPADADTPDAPDVDADTQWRALAAARELLDPHVLVPRAHVLALMSAVSPASDRRTPSPGTAAAPHADPWEIVAVTATIPVSVLLTGPRLTRLDWAAAGIGAPSIDDLVGTLLDATIGREPADERARRVGAVAADVVVAGVLRVLADERVVPRVRRALRRAVDRRQAMFVEADMPEAWQQVVDTVITPTVPELPPAYPL